MIKTDTIFYSWQSDLPGRTNRGFIGDALERAAGALRADETMTIEPVIDRDTAGVPGSPAISDTILQEIAHADIFVPDVSIVMASFAGRSSPNPNVLLEFGYAVSQLGWDRVVMVMNTAFGDVTQLPFDLRGRRVLPYFLQDAPGEPKADVRRELERRLVAPVAPSRAAGVARSCRFRIGHLEAVRSKTVADLWLCANYHADRSR